MPKLKLDIPHTLSAADARSRLERFIESLQAKFQDKVGDLEQAWNGDTLSFGFKTFGIKVAGAIAVEENRLAVTGDLPFSAMMFKGKIENEIREQLTRLVRA